MGSGRALGFALLWLALLARSAHAEPTVVVLLFDGFSPHYLERFPAPSFERLRAEGSFSHRMQPAFPSMSHSSGVTISTGCWPGRHGIVSNRFLDPDRGLYDGSGAQAWLEDCEHLDRAAERYGVRTASLGWYGRRSGSDASRPAQRAVDDLERAEQVAELLARSQQTRPQLVLAYFSGPDDAGHDTGVESDEVRSAVAKADAAVARVLAAIDEQPDADEFQLLVTTDHGMVPADTIINIARILRRHEIAARAVSAGSTSFLYFENPTQPAIDDALRKLSGYTEFEVVRPESQPDDWHLGEGPRVGQLIVSAHPPYFIEDLEKWPWVFRWLRYLGPDSFPTSFWLAGMHGYHPRSAAVEGILYARGSAFEPGREVEFVRAIDLHPTVLELLGLEVAHPVDGEAARALLR